MSNNVLPITNVVSVSVSSPPLGLSNYNVNNLAIISKEVPINGVPAAGFFTYLTAQQVGVDWGTTSETYQQAVAIFSQSPNILAGGGTYQQAVAIFSQSPNILAGGGALIVYPITVQTLTQAITNLQALAFFAGVLVSGWSPLPAEWEAAAAYCQTTYTMLFVSSNLTSDMTLGGLFYVIFGTTNPYARMIYYGQGGSAVSARIFAAGYAGRAMSTNFNGSNTTATMHLKQIAGQVADSTVTQSILASAQAVGVDVYANIAGLPEVFTSGANQFFDQIYNQIWLQYALQVAMFNALAQSLTKVPQTEAGITTLKQAAIAILNQAVTNGYLAPGAWNSTTIFGPGTALVTNIANQGFYVYSQPVNQQSQANRAARQAPLIQIAAKQAGAVHSASVIVYVQP